MVKRGDNAARPCAAGNAALLSAARRPGGPPRSTATARGRPAATRPHQGSPSDRAAVPPHDKAQPSRPGAQPVTAADGAAAPAADAPADDGPGCSDEADLVADFLQELCAYLQHAGDIDIMRGCSFLRSDSAFGLTAEEWQRLASLGVITLGQGELATAPPSTVEQATSKMKASFLVYSKKSAVVARTCRLAFCVGSSTSSIALGACVALRWGPRS